MIDAAQAGSRNPVPPARGPDRTWFQPIRLSNDPHPVRLFCFAHAGGAASTFRPWNITAPDGLEIHAAQLPGRESRITEPPIDRLDDLISALRAAIAPLAADGDFALFGHSTGAVIAWHLARALTEAGGPRPKHLFVSSCHAPAQVRSEYEDLHELGDAALIERLRAMNGTPAAALDNPELMRLVLPAIRADLSLLAQVGAEPARRLDCPVTALGGDHDPMVTPDDLALWAAATTGGLRIEVLDGDHFYLTDPRSDVPGIIAATLTAHAEGQPMTEPTVSERVKTVMTTTLDLGLDPDRLAGDTPLYSTAVQLDSLRLLHLLTALEAEFACQLDDEAVMTAELVDVDSVIALVSAQIEKVSR